MKPTKQKFSASPSPPAPEIDKAPQAWRPRFGIGGVMLLMVVCSVMAASGYYLVQAQQKSTGDNSGNRLGFMLFTLSAPMFVLIVVSILWSLTNRRKTF